MGVIMGVIGVKLSGRSVDWGLVIFILATGWTLGFVVGAGLTMNRLRENAAINRERAAIELKLCTDRLKVSDHIVRTIWKDWAPETTEQR